MISGNAAQSGVLLVLEYRYVMEPIGYPVFRGKVFLQGQIGSKPF